MAAAAAVPRQPAAARTWDDEARDTVQLLLGADLHGLHAWNAAQQGHVFAKAALQRQHADAQLHWLGNHSGCAAFWARQVGEGKS